MTPVVTNPRVEDTDCVEICPVDCFRESLPSPEAAQWQGKTGKLSSLDPALLALPH